LIDTIFNRKNNEDVRLGPVPGHLVRTM